MMMMVPPMMMMVPPMMMMVPPMMATVPPMMINYNIHTTIINHEDHHGVYAHLNNDLIM